MKDINEKTLNTNNLNIKKNPGASFSTFKLVANANNQKTYNLKFPLVLFLIFVVYFSFVIYFNSNPNDKSTINDEIIETEASTTSFTTTKLVTKTLANTVLIDDLQYGEDCDSLENKFCNKIENLVCSINLKCDCNKDWYFKENMCGK